MSYEIETNSLTRVLLRVVKHPDDAADVAREVVRTVVAAGGGQATKCLDGHRFYTVAVTGRYPSDEPGACLEIYALVLLYSEESYYYDPSERVTAEVRTTEWRRPVTPETAPAALRARAEELAEDGEQMDEAETATWARVLGARPWVRIDGQTVVGGAA